MCCSGVTEVDQTDNEKQLERFIQDWHWNEASHELAREMGKFLFEFLDSLEDAGMSERTRRTYVDNCWSIGILSCGYGYHEEFSPAIFLYGPWHVYEFKRKHSDSTYAVDAYTRTCRRLERYVRSLGYGDDEDE